MSNAVKGLIAIIIIIAIAVGAYAVFHNPSSPAPSTNTNQTSQNTPSTTPSTNSIVLTKTDPQLGKILTDPNGKPLYFYNADSKDMSNCTGSCLSNWPPYTATSSMANLPAGITTFTRSDNNQVQYAYNGKPLYYFTGDTGTQATGNGVENFSVAKPSTASAASSTTNSSTTNPSNSSSGYPY